MKTVNNKITIIGSIASELEYSHDVYNEVFYQFTILSDRLSDNKDVLPVVMSERVIGKNTLTVGTPIRVYGQIRSYNHYDSAINRNRLVLTVFAHRIEDAGAAQHINEVFLDCYICKPLVYRETPFGREICDLHVAVNRGYGKSDYIPCIAWGRTARFANTLDVGNNVKLRGRMQSREYQKRQGDGSVDERIAYEVSIGKLEVEQ